MKPRLRKAAKRCAPVTRIACSISAMAGAAAPAETGVGRGWLSATVSSSAATGAPTAAQSGSASSRAQDGRAQALAPAAVGKLRQARPPQQQPQRRIAQRGLVEFRQMRIAAMGDRKQRIADVVQRRPVLGRGERAAGGGGEMAQTHEMV